jgi:hypothetical protein
LIAILAFCLGNISHARSGTFAKPALVARAETQDRS